MTPTADFAGSRVSDPGGDMNFAKMTNEQLVEIADKASAELSKRRLREAKAAGVRLKKTRKDSWKHIREDRVTVKTPLGEIVFYSKGDDGCFADLEGVDLWDFVCMRAQTDPGLDDMLDKIQEGAGAVVKSWPDEGGMCGAALDFYNEHQKLLKKVVK
jgi:hypothetical protein